MNKRFLSIISLTIIIIVALFTGIFLINEINETYSSPEFQKRIITSAEAYQDVKGDFAENPGNEKVNDELGSTDETKATDYPKIKSNFVSWGHESRQSRKIDTVIVHSVYDALGDDRFDLKGVLDEFKIYGVSSHYVIDRDGDIFQLVEEANVAYHAGKSQVPDGRTGVNEFSLGIELINDKEHEPTKDQYRSLKKLLEAIKNKYSIKYILGHSDVAPTRKTDPWNFDWREIE